MNVFRAILLRDLKLAWRQGGGFGAALGFMLAVIVLVPLSLGPDQVLLRRLAPGFMWLTLLLAVLLTAERTYSQDLEDGSLEVLTMTSLPLEAVAIAKAMAHWLTVGLPLAVVSPFVGFMLNLEANQLPLLLTTMTVGSLALSMLATLGGAITAGLKRGGLLISLLILPLYLPVLIFGVSAIAAAATPSGSTPSFLVLMAITLISCVISPWASAAALRIYLR
jgi:heme exporter protein B